MIKIGGKIRYGYKIVSGVVSNEVKNYIDSKVFKGEFLSRSQAINFIITEYVYNKKNTEFKNSQFNAYKHNVFDYKL